MSEITGSAGMLGTQSTNGHRATGALPKGLAGAAAGVGGGTLWFVAQRRRRSRREKAEARARQMAESATGKAGGLVRSALKAGAAMAGRRGAVTEARAMLARGAEELPPKVADGLSTLAERAREGSWQGWAVLAAALWAVVQWSDRRQLRKLVLATTAVNRALATRPPATSTPAALTPA